MATLQYEDIFTDPNLDFQPGGIDAVLATLKPKARKRSARPDAQNPCERCGFDLADMGPSYANENILCPSCRETTNIGLPNSAPLAKSMLFSELYHPHPRHRC